LKKIIFFKNRKLLHTSFDISMLLDILFINIFGVVMIYSASYYYAQETYGYAANHFFLSQIKYVAAGLVVMLLISYVRPSIFQQILPWQFTAVLALLFIAAVRIPGLGWSSHGAYRWVRILGQTLQIAEPVKVLSIFALAGFLTQHKVNDKRTLIFVFVYFGVSSLLLLVLSNNMSTALVVFSMAFLTMMLISPDSKYYLLVMFGLLIAAGVVILLIQFVIPFSETENFRITRIRAWLDPENELFIDDEAYQAQQARYAIASGGFFGKGLGKSLIKFTLPEPHNDYILAIIFEELGVVGVSLLTYLFGYLLYKIYLIYLHTKDRFSKIFVIGVFLHFSLQIVLNYFVTLGILPTMGVTLPFISAGGSAAFFSLVELGFVIAIDRSNTEKELYLEAKQELESEDPYYKRLAEEMPEEEEDVVLLPRKKKKNNRSKKRKRAHEWKNQ